MWSLSKKVPLLFVRWSNPLTKLIKFLGSGTASTRVLKLRGDEFRIHITFRMCAEQIVRIADESSRVCNADSCRNVNSVSDGRFKDILFQSRGVKAADAVQLRAIDVMFVILCCSSRRAGTGPMSRASWTESGRRQHSASESSAPRPAVMQHLRTPMYSSFDSWSFPIVRSRRRCSSTTSFQPGENCVRVAASSGSSEKILTTSCLEKTNLVPDRNLKRLTSHLCG